MEDDESCRICRSGPEPGAPLYHPCKCTGSIRYCHQDCLVEWLQHSRKKYCELCNQPFIFQKKYRRDMPSDGKLPRYLYMRRFVLRSIHIARLAGRAILVGFTWLALLPYININVWRFWFWCIDYAILYWFVDVATRLGMTGLVVPYATEAAPPANSSLPQILNRTSSTSSKDLDSLPKFSILDAWSRLGSPLPTATLAQTPTSITSVKAALHSLVQKLAHDVFQGQILSCVIVVFFVGVFLLREWILQNMPQNFDPQPNLDQLEPAQPLPDVPEPQPHTEREPDLEQRRDQLADLPARIPTPEDYQDAPYEGANVHEAERSDELDLDPETQREQARLARIRRLEQVTSAQQEENLASPLIVATDTASGLNNASLEADNVAATQAGSSEVRVESQQLDSPADVFEFTSTQNLRDALGWSETPHFTFERAQAVSPDERLREADVPAEAPLEAQQYPSDASNTVHHGASSSSSTEPSASSELAARDTADAPVATEEAQSSPRPSTEADVQVDTNIAPLDDVPDEQDDDDAWQDESDDDELAAPLQLDGADEAALRAAAAAAFPPPIAHPVAADDEIEIMANAAGAGAEPDDPEAEIGLAEEMDGILEAIGMRGPIFGIIQNLFLMIFLSFFVMQVFVMVPYVVGRLFGSGPGLIRVLALPVKALRYVTDPVFDGLIAVGAKSWPKLIGVVGASGARKGSGGTVGLQSSLSGWIPSSLSNMFSQTAAKATTGVGAQGVSSATSAKSSAVASMLASVLPARVTTSLQWKAVSNAFEVALATGFPGTVERMTDAICDVFTRIDSYRLVTTTTDRAVCVAFGHAYWLLILIVHQRLSKPELHRAVGEQSTLKMLMGQHVLIIKAISFIFIELIVFPLGCGLLFDICTMPFLAQASIASWPDKAWAAPLSFAFTRWMGGTIYMFVFAQYVSATRKVLRPGVLCWIRDPNDPSFHPIREILDKKSWTQLRKIAASAVMYAAILVASIGVNTYFLRYVMGWTGVLPLRWRPFDPWTEVPVDLLLVHFALPWATQRVNPDKLAEKWLTRWWRGASRMLRLSSYMLGGEFKEERRRVRGNALVNAWNAWMNRRVRDEDYVDDGLFCSVPADDKAITSGPLIIPMNADGSPATERMAEAYLKQQADAQKHTPKPTYTLIYLPSNYRVRITTIVTLLWLSHCALFMLGLSIPLLIGRAMSGVLTAREVHDLYSFGIGITVLVVSAKLYRGVRKTWMRRTTRARYIRTTPRMYVAIRVMVEMKRMFKSMLLLAGMAGVVPLVIGLVVDQYVLVPLRYRSTQVAVLHLGHIWACGVVQARLLLFTTRMLGVPGRGWYARFMDDVDEVVRGGVYPRPKVRLAWKRVVAPVGMGGLVMLAIPVGVAYGLATSGWVHVETRQQEQLLLRKTIGALQSAMLVTALRAALINSMDGWTELLKDEVFLESTELINYEEIVANRNARAVHDAQADAPRATTADVQDAQDAQDAENADNAAAADADADADAADAHAGYVAQGTLPDVLFR
ncbi:E3 ubiquitin-protein ligase SSM4 [Mycosarcoma maydis]|uniref:RING-type E3 ubiquitin transferase n=1 Tax=Mycosarcoma maydis TaxID=5270 RepID=A0A0D1CL60_MYCMD|nr:E3 ubiquitin-protein ligase SSM4 [Ustilago maydis 521]KIS67488.1 hypothetical protein UMAG_10911 [Ustilago maydis 521]|eukprot:XP_011390969.1 hypothetical protein UMAG_10911 [Ustilago maydis 521]